MNRLFHGSLRNPGGLFSSNQRPPLEDGDGRDCWRRDKNVDKVAQDWWYKWKHKSEEEKKKSRAAAPVFVFQVHPGSGDPRLISNHFPISLERETRRCVCTDTCRAQQSVCEKTNRAKKNVF